MNLARQGKRQKDRLFLKGLKNNMLEGVIFVGEVSDEFLPHLYSGADVFVSPSLYEGFGKQERREVRNVR